MWAVILPLITFAEAEAIGQRLHDHWERMAGNAPLQRDDMGWGDLVQQTLRFARDVVDSRQPSDGR